MADVLYIHPLGHLNELPIPAGAISAMNALTTPPLGRYAFEVKDEEIARARLIAIDLHWAIALSGFASLVAHVRHLRPDVPLIAGGITAGLLAPALLARFPLDYVLVGDSEVAFRTLALALLAGESAEGIPNVATRATPHPARRRMSAAEFDAADCLSGDWFPTWARMSDWHSVAFSPARTIPVARGCAFRCAACFGSHAGLYGPGVLLRTPAQVANEFRRALDMGIEALRLILGKVPAVYLATLAATLVEHGPFPFRQTVGFFLCTPPDPVALEQSLAAGAKNRRHRPRAANT